MGLIIGIMLLADDADIGSMRYRRVSVRVRRAAVGCLALVGVLATISHGVTGHAAPEAWFVALVVAGGSFAAVVRYGNASFLYPGSRVDPRYVAAVALLAGLALVHALLPANWSVTFWGALAGGLFGFTVSPPSSPAND